ncbi:hypothetical protein PR048_029477 [Dryococelus australis]|uniref:Saposin B-type domain-containing protein n=1 Tax=Dryococelus australis TaxID=614101 RepID=A0ABQ9GDH7_9NEOP|nr:hypothetical protein PR048_029477 [Dryococelus australis]
MISLLVIFCVLTAGNYVDCRGINGGVGCAACTIMSGITSQLTLIQNETIYNASLKLCNKLPSTAKEYCDTFVFLLEPLIISSFAEDDAISAMDELTTKAPTHHFTSPSGIRHSSWISCRHCTLATFNTTSADDFEDDNSGYRCGGSACIRGNGDESAYHAKCRPVEDYKKKMKGLLSFSCKNADAPATCMSMLLSCPRINGSGKPCYILLIQYIEAVGHEYWLAEANPMVALYQGNTSKSSMFLLSQRITQGVMLTELRETNLLPLNVLYNLPPGKEVFADEAYKARNTSLMRSIKNIKALAKNICKLPIFNSLCSAVNETYRRLEPFFDADGDGFSMFQDMRGTYWRGKDCADWESSAYPGRQPLDGDISFDHNCNGIFGRNPVSGQPYETELCKNSGARGVAYFGDSVGGHFHFPDAWLNPVKVPLDFHLHSVIKHIVLDEINWPQLGYATGFMNSTEPTLVQGFTDSIYLRLRTRNLCNHRDYQNLAQNADSSFDVPRHVFSLARNKNIDKPLLIFYAVLGIDVCNEIKMKACAVHVKKETGFILLEYTIMPDCRFSNTFDHMTKPATFRKNVHNALKLLDVRVPVDSHVVLLGLVDGGMIFDIMADRLHPIGILLGFLDSFLLFRRKNKGYFSVVRHGGLEIGFVCAYQGATWSAPTKVSGIGGASGRGQLNGDVHYRDVYRWFNCMEIGPCYGWLNENATIRKLTTKSTQERRLFCQLTTFPPSGISRVPAPQSTAIKQSAGHLESDMIRGREWNLELETSYKLNAMLKDVAATEKFNSFDVHYLENPLHEIFYEWQKNNSAWMLVESVDSLHPTQLAQPAITDALWKKMLANFPHVLGEVNPNNERIKQLFKDQGGH